MTYGSEHTRTKLMTAEMDFWRRSSRVSRREKIRNEAIKAVSYTHLDVYKRQAANCENCIG